MLNIQMDYLMLQLYKYLAHLHYDSLVVRFGIDLTALNTMDSTTPLLLLLFHLMMNSNRRSTSRTNVVTVDRSAIYNPRNYIEMAAKCPSSRSHSIPSMDPARFSFGYHNNRIN